MALIVPLQPANGDDVNASHTDSWALSIKQLQALTTATIFTNAGLLVCSVTAVGSVNGLSAVVTVVAQVYQQLVKINWGALLTTVTTSTDVVGWQIYKNGAMIRETRIQCGGTAQETATGSWSDLLAANVGATYQLVLTKVAGTGNVQSNADASRNWFTVEADQLLVIP